MIKRTLFIIGNGFDLYHRLPTSTSDFCNILSSKKVYGYADDAREIFMNYGVDWGEYESSLGLLDLNEIEECNLSMPDYLSDHEYDRDGTIWYMEEHLESLRSAIEESLSEMVESANEQLYDTDIRIKNMFKKEDVVLSFNYTSTLEKLYEIEGIPILHIHGYYGCNEKLLFGYKNGKNAKEYRKRYFDPLDDGRDYYVDLQRESVAQFYESCRKKLQLDKLRNFLTGIRNIDQIYVMGHSMSYVDSEYMELIEEILTPSKWYISQYNNSPCNKELSMYSFANKVIFYSLSDLK